MPKANIKPKKKRSRVGETVIAHIGRLRSGNPNLGLPVICYACDKPHEACCLARIEHSGTVTDVPICAACHDNPDTTTGRLIRKVWNSPKLKISQGGEVTTEQLDALSERVRQNKPEH